MDKKQTATLLTYLRSAYPNHAETLATPETAMVWHEALKDIDYAVAQAAILKWVMTEKWPPSIADIRSSAVEITTETVKDWSEAWSDVERAVRLIGPYREAEAMARFDEATLEAVRRMNYQKLCEMESSERDIVRAQFRDIYKQVANRRKEAAQLPTPLQDRIKAMQIGVPDRERIERGGAL